jgi:hypothetical protein
VGGTSAIAKIGIARHSMKLPRKNPDDAFFVVC